MKKKGLMNLLAVAFVSVCVIASVYWYSFAEKTGNPEDTILISPDATYQLHRIEQCLEHYPLVKSYDLNSHYPTGQVVHWPNAYTFTLSTLANIFNVEGSQALAGFLKWIPVCIGVLSLLLVFLLLYQSQYPLIALFLLCPFLIFSPETSLNFHIGDIDHHAVMQISFFLLMIQFWRLQWFIYGLGLFLAFMFTPESILFVSLFLFLGQLTFFLTKQPRQHAFFYFHENAVAFFLPFLVSTLAYVVHWLLLYHKTVFFLVDPTVQSLFQPLWFLALGCVCFILTGKYSTEKSFSLVQILLINARSILIVSTVFICVLALGLWWCGALELIQERFVNAERIFVAEESSPLFFPTFLDSYAHYKLYLFYVLYTFVKTVKSGFRDEKWFIVFFVLLFGLTEFRHLKNVSFVVYLGLVMILYDLGWVLLNESLLKKMRKLVIGIALMFIYLGVFFLLPARKMSTSEKLFLSAVHEIRECNQQNVFETKGAVFGPWSLGHHINYMLKKGVSVDPFNFPNPITPVLNRVLLEKNAFQYRDALDELDISYLMYFMPDVEFGNIMNETLPNRYLKYLNVGGHRVFVFEPYLQDFPFMRAAYDFNYANFNLGLKMSYCSEGMEFFLEEVGGEMILDRRPFYQVYQRTPQVKLEGQLPQNSFIHLEYQLLFSNGDSRNMDHFIEVEEDGCFCFEIANPAPMAVPGLAIPGPYFLQTETHFAYITISNQDLRFLRPIEIEWHRK